MEEEPSDVKVCRVCFAANCKLYPMTVNNILCKAYETLTGLLVEDEDHIPLYLCSECARRLLNCARFRITSLRAHLTLLEIVKKYDCITLDLIQSVKGGGQSPFHSNKTDYNLDIELAAVEIISTNKQLDIKLREENAVDGVKAERNYVFGDVLTNEDTGDDDRACMSNSLEDMAHCYVKAENYEEINLSIVKVEGTVNDDPFNTTNSLENKYIVNNGVKVEKDDAYNQDSRDVQDTTDDHKVWVAGVPQDIAEDCIKTENGCIKKQKGVDENSTSALYQELTDRHLSEDCATCDILVPEARQNAKTSPTGAPGATDVARDAGRAKIDSRRQPPADGPSLDNTLSCDICPYRTNSERQLSSHWKAHAADVSYSCDICSYITILKGSLNRHLKSHSSETPYSCNVCNRAFNEKGNLGKHMRTHTGEKPFSCNTCNKLFTYKANLLAHMRLHSDKRPFLCNICNNSISSKSHLKRHMRIHSGEKPYSCEICNKPFNHKSNLITHMRTHSGEKPFSCNICQKPFNDKSNLARHLITHSGDKAFRTKERTTVL